MQVRFERPPTGTLSWVVSSLADDAEKAAAMSREALQPELFARRPVALDFRGLDVCTQGFLHALLFEAVRLSWATRTPIYIENAAPGVQVGVRLVDNYARGG